MGRPIHTRIHRGRPPQVPTRLEETETLSTQMDQAILRLQNPVRPGRRKPPPSRANKHQTHPTSAWDALVLLSSNQLHNDYGPQFHIFKTIQSHRQDFQCHNPYPLLSSNSP